MNLATECAKNVREGSKANTNAHSKLLTAHSHVTKVLGHLLISCILLSAESLQDYLHISTQ